MTRLTFLMWWRALGVRFLRVEFVLLPHWFANMHACTCMYDVSLCMLSRTWRSCAFFSRIYSYRDMMRYKLT